MSIWIVVAAATVVLVWLYERYTGICLSMGGTVVECDSRPRFATDYRYASPREVVTMVTVRGDDGSSRKARIKPGGAQFHVGDRVVVGLRASRLRPGHLYVTGVSVPAAMGT